MSVVAGEIVAIEAARATEASAENAATGVTEASAVAGEIVAIEVAGENIDSIGFGRGRNNQFFSDFSSKLPMIDFFDSLATDRNE